MTMLFKMIFSGNSDMILLSDSTLQPGGHMCRHDFSSARSLRYIHLCRLSYPEI